MNRNELLQSAAGLTAPPPPAAAEFDQKKVRMADELNRRMGNRSDLELLIGEGNRPMMEENSRNFCGFMSAMFYGYEPAVLVETVLWVLRTYRAHGFQPAYWPANIETFMDIARNELSSETVDALLPFFNWLIDNIPALATLTEQETGSAMEEPPAHEKI